MSERHRTISGREAMRCGTMVAASASVVAPIDSAQSETAEYAELRAAQGAANSKPGPRTVPAKVITAPGGLDPATAALVAAPYSPLWNLTAPDDAGWRAIVKKASDAALPTLATARAALAVTVEPIKVGGVNAFILTPKEIPAAHTNQLMVNLHGGGWIFGAGESGTAEAMQLAAIGGYKVLAIDYRMPPDAPYPAATDDVTAAWRAIVGTMDPRRIAIEGTSAGAGFTVSLMLRAKAEELPLPGAIALCSPPCDLTATGDSFRTNEWIDNVICELRRLSEPRAPTLRGRPQPQGPAVVPNIWRLSRLPAGHPHDRHARPTPLRHGASAPQTPEGQRHGGFARPRGAVPRATPLRSNSDGAEGSVRRDCAFLRRASSEVTWQLCLLRYGGAPNHPGSWQHTEMFGDDNSYGERDVA
jgi:monoterpene epsilon-lactone hydrolase